jgi:hypothetical protein
MLNLQSPLNTNQENLRIMKLNRENLMPLNITKNCKKIWMNITKLLLKGTIIKISNKSNLIDSIFETIFLVVPKSITSHNLI